jgi:glycosyltransferase involved in cell wall biosynthesis
LTAHSGPRFTIVSAVYNVEPYLADFIASVEAQNYDLGRVEVVMVDDGSSDDSLATLEAWASRRPDLVRVMSQSNAGQGAARNTGLAAAQGEWVTFPDPDDVLEPSYLAAVDSFLHTHPEAVMVATNRLIWNEAANTIRNAHPLEMLFTYDRLADLDLVESSFHGSAPAAFFDLGIIRSHDLRFDTRIRPNFEDGHFCSSYLLHCDRTLVGFLASARYHYRKRADQSSSLQGSMLDRRRYTDVFEFGYLAILDEAERLRGHVPLWLQHFICYELLGYLSVYEGGRVPTLGEGPEVDVFHRSMAKVMDRFDSGRVLDRTEFFAPRHLRQALAHGYADRNWHEGDVLIDKLDEQGGLARARYFFTGEVPSEEVYSRESPSTPPHAKTRDLRYFGRTLLRERILWVHFTPDLRICVGGSWAELAFEPPERRVTRALARRVRRLAGSPSRHDRLLVAALQPDPTSRIARKAKRRAATTAARRKFSDAWVLMDRIHDAGDSGEILFRRLRTHHQEINAWFVIEKGTPDWHRLRRDFGSRVVAHRSLEWRVLMAHCSNLLSSHADVPIMEPDEIEEFTERKWKFTFLQHGVIKDDLSSWLSRKEIDLFVTSTPQEHASISGDGTGYPFTTKEVKLTGLPRFDRLREIGTAVGPAARDLVLLTPSWRQWLVQQLGVGTQRRRLQPEVMDSQFVHEWMELLCSDVLAESCARNDVRLALLPHPNLQELVPRMELPGHITAFSYGEGDVKELFARARVLVTDYSSIAFNAAYLDRPVVYFQFDHDLVLNGGHVGRRGYFDYRRDGFGPVTHTAAEAATAIDAALRHGPSPMAPYAERVASTFPFRDGLCSERVIEAVLRADTGEVEANSQPTDRG